MAILVKQTTGDFEGGFIEMDSIELIVVDFFLHEQCGQIGTGWTVEHACN